MGAKRPRRRNNSVKWNVPQCVGLKLSKWNIFFIQNKVTIVTSDWHFHMKCHSVSVFLWKPQNPKRNDRLSRGVKRKKQIVIGVGMGMGLKCNIPFTNFPEKKSKCPNTEGERKYVTSRTPLFTLAAWKKKRSKFVLSLTVSSSRDHLIQVYLRY